ncbi:hypothetical protein [Kutzneria buriramensis]|uniref:Uncharacterized protein n=1 Tax=Kutzneria buriramensis TaxID=1045776 RepID=A0A3E0HEN7_9PSEU|nr:hypothetical protein [Kutzneria buriramensis]REH43702.1 hypothetical protein BCF44_109245 [Kutzneria buriramensis]
MSNGQVIGDAVSSCGLMIALYYGLTGITAARVHRRSWRAVLPAIGGLVLFGAGMWSLRNDWDPANSATSWTLPFPPHRQIGGIFVIGVGALLVGQAVTPAFFRRSGASPAR